ncbi:hypothetical protein Tco_1438513 [Tanacetum coccineum]
MPNPPPITPVLLVFISDKQALVVMRSSMAKVFFMGRWGYGIDPQSHKPCKACFVFEGFSEDHFSMVEIDNATGIFQYHEVAFVYVGMSLEDVTDHAGDLDIVWAFGSYFFFYPRGSRML